VSSLPTFIIIGAMKAGTTSLFRHLGTHPDVSISKRKETDFFVGRHEFERGLDWYGSLFDPSRSARGEASPNYTKRHVWTGIAERIATTLPEVRLIFVARDPIMRITSHYMHNVSKGRENRPFTHAIIENRGYIQTSRYAYQLEPFVEQVARDRIMFIDSDDLSNDTSTTLKAVFDFIGVRADHEVTNLDTRFHMSTDKTRKSVLERRVGNPRVRDLLRPLLPSRLSERQPVQRPRPTATDIDFLTGELRDDVARFRALTGLAFAQWSL
jgi:hypothetical protein